MRKISFDAQALIGKKFGKLIVIRELPQEGYNRYVGCLCDCGNEKKVGIFRLTTGHTRSCGCLKKESMTAIRQKQIEKNGLLPFGQSTKNVLYKKYKTSAQKRGIEFNLSQQNFEQLIKLECFYCGEPPITKKVASGSSKDFVFANGVDRIDNKHGYAEGNCVPCCKFCNSAKNNYTKEEFLSKIRKIYARHN